MRDKLENSIFIGALHKRVNKKANPKRGKILIRKLTVKFGKKNLEWEVKEKDSDFEFEKDNQRSRLRHMRLR